MRIAVPTLDGVFCEHFGRADGFFLCDVGPGYVIERPRSVVRPKAQCERVPQWLREMAVTAVLAGGIGQVAQQHLAKLGIVVVPGQSGSNPLEIAAEYVQGRAKPRHNLCQTLEHRSLHCRGKRGQE